MEIELKKIIVKVIHTCKHTEMSPWGDFHFKKMIYSMSFWQWGKGTREWSGAAFRSLLGPSAMWVTGLTGRSSCLAAGAVTHQTISPTLTERLLSSHLWDKNKVWWFRHLSKTKVHTHTVSKNYLLKHPICVLRHLKSIGTFHDYIYLKNNKPAKAYALLF